MIATEQLIPYNSTPERLNQETRLLVIGQTSMVGGPFVESLVDNENLHFIVGRRVDVTKKQDWEYALTSGPVDAIAYYAAYTDVKKAQSEDRQLCIDVNVGRVVNLLETMAEAGVNPHIYYVSTNLVFPALAVPCDGKAFAEDEPIDDENIEERIYGGSKAKAERKLSEFVKKHPTAKVLVARINQPVGEKFGKKPNYLQRHLGLARKGGLYPMLVDAWVGLTGIEGFAQDMTQLITERRTGVFHFSTTRVTPYDLMTYAIAKAGIDFVVKQSKSDELVEEKLLNPYLNPRFSDLGTARTREILDMPEQSWQALVDKLVAQGITV